ncbi:hypothetical protein EMB92_10735 [Bifidobacterium callitrichos]|uniref:Uncharacterized protein n=1 Tax=Bifidobacterium callitrichos TaxID=762209 RepID=A0A5M9Z9F4_9BIFI|nr:hypothetical protein [Bifidobacterium callitrichos]KAA8815134.1 hypothetical protein EMB92_10735 [Bifidobacterium callitrichos]
MKVVWIALFKESSRFDLVRGPQGVIGKARNLSFSLGLSETEGKPWSNEFVIRMEMRTEDMPTNADPLLATELHYAVSFDRPKVDTVPLDIIWPFVRPDLIAQLRRYELPGDTIPLQLSEANSKQDHEG